MASVELKYDRPTDTFRDYAEAANKLDKELGEAMLQATGHASGRVGSSLHQRINSTTGYRYHRATKEDARKSREEVRDMLKYIFQMNFPGLNPYEMGDA